MQPKILKTQLKSKQDKFHLIDRSEHDAKSVELADHASYQGKYEDTGCLCETACIRTLSKTRGPQAGQDSTFQSIRQPSDCMIV